MREADIIYKTKAALSFAARGGMRASLFCDTVADDAEMLAGLPDKIEGENLQ